VTVIVLAGFGYASAVHLNGLGLDLSFKTANQSRLAAPCDAN
jgi:hypothetical protein